MNPRVTTTVEAEITPLEPPANPQPAIDNESPPEGLFPLALTPFEKLMLDDDHPDYPRIFVVVAELSGELIKEAFESAVRKVIDRNPLLRSIITRQKSRPHWVLTEFPEGQILWGEPPARFETTSFNLRKNPGFRVCGRTDGETSEIHFILHHAVTDGHGTRRVIVDLLSHYAAIVNPGPKSAPLDRLNYDRLRSRGEILLKEPPKPAPEVRPVQASLSQRLKTIYDFFSQQPVPIRPGKPRSGRQPGPQSPSHRIANRFSADEVNCFRGRLRGTGITLNDLAIALLLNSIARWNRSHGETGKDCLYRILVPVDLRDSADEFLPAANRLSFVFITRHTSLCLDLPRLIPTIRAEMDYIEEHGSKYNLLKALPVVQSIPGLIPLGVRLPICLSTAVLTNMGDVLRKLRHRFPDDDGRIVFGNLRFIRAGGAPPVRSKTGLGIGLTVSGGEILIRGQFDSQVFSADDAEEFMTFFMETWRSWAEQPSTSST